MQKLFLLALILLVSCATGKTIKKEPKIVFNDNYGDPVTNVKAHKIYHDLTSDEKKLIIKYYVSNFQLATADKCHMKPDALQLAGIPRLNIPYIDIHRANKEFFIVTGLDLSRDEDQKVSDLRSAVEAVDKKLEAKKKPKLTSIDSADGFLLRTGTPGKIKYFMCNKQKDSVLCSEDKVIKQLVDVEKYPSFCSWLNDKDRKYAVSRNVIVREILQDMMRVKLL